MKSSLLRPRRKPVKRSRIKKRPRKKSERERIYGPKGFVEWIHEQPCAGCGIVGHSVTAHIENGGMSRKADWTRTIPLCAPHTVVDVSCWEMYTEPGCHYLYDEQPWKFAARYPFLDLDLEAKHINALWLSFSGGSPKTGNGK